EVPFQVQKSRLVEKIAQLLEEKKLPLLADVRDESAEDVRLVFEPKTRNVDPELLIEQLFRTTELEVRVPLNLNVLDPAGVPRVMNLKEALREFLDHRRIVLQRRSRCRLAAIERRMEVLRGLVIVYINLDEVIRIIREEDEPKAVMMARWELTDAQAEAILNMRLRALRRLEEVAIRKELEELGSEAGDIEKLLSSDRRQWTALSREITATQKEFGGDTPLGPRRTQLAAGPRRAAGAARRAARGGAGAGHHPGAGADGARAGDDPVLGQGLDPHRQGPQRLGRRAALQGGRRAAFRDPRRNHRPPADLRQQ